jgi:hypothetical protein
MRFVAQYPDFAVGIKAEKSRLTSDGEVILREEGIIASFSTRGWEQRDLEVALASFQFKGLYQHEDEATPVNPAYRLSYYDTDEMAETYGWEEDTKAMVEQRLLSARSYGRAFVVVPDVPLDPPWPLYNDFDGTPQEMVLVCHSVIGVPFEAVVEYEKSRWGRNREDVIEAFTEAIQIRDEGKVVIT